MENEREKVPGKEFEDSTGSKNEILAETSLEKGSQDEADLLYTHKPENQGNGIQWNSTFCRKIGR